MVAVHHRLLLILGRAVADEAAVLQVLVKPTGARCHRRQT